MIYLKDPPRLRECETTPRALREWLANAQRYEPSAAEIQRLTEAVDCLDGLERLGLARPEMIHPPATHAARMGDAIGVTKLFATVVIGVAAAGAGLWSWLDAHHGRPASSATQLSFSSAPPAWREEVLPPPSPISDALPAEVGSSEHVISPPSPAVRGRSSGRGLTPANRSPNPANKATRVIRGTEAVAPSDTGAKAVVGAEEWRILRAARRAMSTDPAHALALAREHAQKFPDGMLSQEREAIAIEALARLGRTSEAKARAESFSGSFPASPYRRRNEAAVSRSVEPETQR
jgi:hypothetical protein